MQCPQCHNFLTPDDFRREQGRRGRLARICRVCELRQEIRRLEEKLAAEVWLQQERRERLLEMARAARASVLPDE